MGSQRDLVLPGTTLDGKVMNESELLKALNELRTDLGGKIENLRADISQQRDETKEQLDRLGERITNAETTMSFVGWAAGIQGGDYRPTHLQRAPAGKTLIAPKSDWPHDHPYRR
jgi:molybdopterin converting factor small subunit